MVTVLPFHGLRYAPELVAASLFAPPYDVIDPRQRLAHLAGNPNNIVHIDLGPDQDPAWYAEAARIRDRWLAERVLLREPQPALYGYQQHFAVGDKPYVRTGLLGTVRLAEWGRGIHPHERTRVGPRQDRLNLMRALRAQSSPVFGMYRDPSDEIGRWLTPPAQPDVDVTDAEGVRHLFWPITDGAALGALTAALARRDVVIADGHHRYETALAYRAERRAAEGNPGEQRPYDAVLMYLTSAESDGLRILAAHRVVHAPIADPQALLNALRADFDLLALESAAHLSAAVTQTAPGEIAFGLCLGRAGAWLLKLRDRAAAQRHAGGLPAEIATLDVVALQDMILAPHLGISAQALAHDDSVSYTVNAEEACESVHAGRAQAAFILNPTRIDQVWHAALKGVTMPQKSTYFWPKLLTGLVLNPLD